MSLTLVFDCRAALHAVDRYFMQIRREIAGLERGIAVASNKRRIWYGYTPYDPSMIPKLLDIHRAYYNWIQVSSMDGLARAQRFGWRRGRSGTRTLFITNDDVVWPRTRGREDHYSNPISAILISRLFSRTRSRRVPLPGPNLRVGRSAPSCTTTSGLLDSTSRSLITCLARSLSSPDLAAALPPQIRNRDRMRFRGARQSRLGHCDCSAMLPQHRGIMLRRELITMKHLSSQSSGGWCR